jgi:Septum formation
VPISATRWLRRGAPLLALLLGLLTACSNNTPTTGPVSTTADPQARPKVGACRLLTPEDVAAASNDTEPVPCKSKHTAETFLVTEFPEELADAAYDDPALGRRAYRACSMEYMSFLGADESLVMRTVMNWAWFRPSEAAWDAGARWFRCDVVGGGAAAAAYLTLPKTARGILLRPRDKWLVCASGPSIADSEKVPCSEPHNWRAVTTIKLGEPKDPYPGDRVAEVRTRDFCSGSVGAWLGYPVNYDFGYTWHHEAEWEAGNRRSVCWAQTEK